MNELINCRTCYGLKNDPVNIELKNNNCSQINTYIEDHSIPLNQENRYLNCSRKFYLNKTQIILFIYNNSHTFRTYETEHYTFYI